jgi:hypothetical protein
MKYPLTLELGRAMLPLVRTMYGPVGAEASCRQGYFWVMDARTEGEITVAEALPMWTTIPVTWGSTDGPHCGAIRKARWLDLRGIDGPCGAVALVQLFKSLDGADSPWWRTPSAHLVLAFEQRWQPKLDAAPGRPASPAKLLEVVSASLRAAPPAPASRRPSSTSSAAVTA